MRQKRPVSLRFLVAFGIAALCGGLAVALHYQTASTVSQASDGFMIGAPPPPPAFFPESFFVIPGVLAGLPLALPGAILGLEWLTQTGLVLGAAVFWYCVGWHVDSARAILRAEKPPAMVRWYLSAVIVICIILLPFAIVAGLNLGVHSCANGANPYWVDLVGYGILMFWITVGSYFGWLRLQARREQKHSFISLEK